MATEPTARTAKLIQYLNEAYGKERELETSLKSHLSLTTRDMYKKRLREHLRETQQQARGLERRIKQLGGTAETTSLPGPELASRAAGRVVTAAHKGVALAQGPLHALRGLGEAETQLKNAKTELFNEYEEIGTYLAIEELATAVRDRDTAKLAREFRRQEERMAAFLLKLIPQLSKQVARDEIPADERAAASNGGSRRRRASRAGSSRRASSSSRTRARATAARRSRATSRRTRAGAARRSRATPRRASARRAAAAATSSRASS